MTPSMSFLAVDTYLKLFTVSRTRIDALAGIAVSSLANTSGIFAAAAEVASDACHSWRKACQSPLPCMAGLPVTSTTSAPAGVSARGAAPSEDEELGV